MLILAQLCVRFEVTCELGFMVWYIIKRPCLRRFCAYIVAISYLAARVWMQWKFIFMFPRKNDLGAYAAHNFQKEFFLGRCRLWMLDDSFLQSGIHHLGHYGTDR